jgi:hypothetical protein
MSLGGSSQHRLLDDFPILRQGLVPNELAAAVIEFRHFLYTKIVHKQNMSS